MKVAVLSCLRCGHEWARRKREGAPIQCPKCHSPYWDKERVKEKETK
jgi:DNA-directed RNA polymerase subunit RPC12/RpoP